MGKGDAVELSLDCSDDLPVTMPKARHRSTARPIEILLAALVNEITTLPPGNDWRLDLGVTGKDVAHGCCAP